MRIQEGTEKGGRKRMEWKKVFGKKRGSKDSKKGLQQECVKRMRTGCGDNTKKVESQRAEKEAQRA